MKQIQSIFIDDNEYKKLVLLKEQNNWTWKDLLLSTIKKEVEEDGDIRT